MKEALKHISFVIFCIFFLLGLAFSGEKLFNMILKEEKPKRTYTVVDHTGKVIPKLFFYGARTNLLSFKDSDGKGHYFQGNFSCSED